MEPLRKAPGVGLAAPQVFSPVRVAVIEVKGNNPRYPYKPAIPLTVVVNPVKVPAMEELREIICGGLAAVGWPEPAWLETTPEDPGRWDRHRDRRGALRTPAPRGAARPARRWQHPRGCRHRPGLRRSASGPTEAPYYGSPRTCAQAHEQAVARGDRSDPP